MVPLQFTLWWDPVKADACYHGTQLTFSSAAILPEGASAVLAFFHLSSCAAQIKLQTETTLWVCVSLVSLSSRQGKQGLEK